MSRHATALTAAVMGAVTLAATACSSPPSTCASQPSGGQSSSSATAAPQSKFFNQGDFDRQMAERRIAPQGDPNTPWLQMIQPAMVDTAKYTKHGRWHLCFSNAALDNPWRVTVLTTMKAEVKLHPEISQFIVIDAGGKDDKQITDITDLQTRGCSALIVSPNTTNALTPAIERACQTGVPVIVFDRGVTTDCPVSFVHPIGGYAFGAASAEFIAQKAGKGGKGLALRILPGADVLENRWAAAKVIFDKAAVDVVGVEFTDRDPAKTKTIAGDYLQRLGQVDSVLRGSRGPGAAR